MSKDSDIIKIGFDYRSSLEQFEKETNGVFDEVSNRAGKQKIVLQLDAKDDKLVEKIKELQKLKLDKFTFEFGDSGLKEQLQTFDRLEGKINEIIKLSKSNLKSVFNDVKNAASLDSLSYGTDEYNNELKRVTSSIVEMGKKGQDSTREYFIEVQKLLNLYELFRKRADGNLFNKNMPQANKFNEFIKNSQLTNDLDPLQDTTSDIFNGCLAILDNFVDVSTKKFLSLKDVIEKVISVGGELKSIADINVGKDNDINPIIDQQGNLQDELKETETQAEKTAQAVKEVTSATTSTEQKKDAFPSTETKPETEGMKQVEEATNDAVQAKKDFATANEGVQKAVNDTSSAIKNEQKVIDNGLLPSLDEYVKRANEAAYELTKGKDIVSQVGKKEVYKVTETDENGKTMERIVGQFSYVEKTLDGQLKNVLATYDESTGRWNEEVLSLATNFEKVGNEIIALDNKINKLEMHRDKMVSEHPGYDTSADDELIDVQKSRRFVLEQTLGLYANEKEYVYEIDAFEKKRVENNRAILALKEQQNNTQQVKQDEKSENKLNTDWEKAIGFNKEFDEALAETKQKLDKLSVPKELEAQWIKLIDYADELRVKLANNKIDISEYKSSINSKLSECNSNVNIQQNRDKETFDTAAKEQENKLLDRQKQIWNDLTASLERYSLLQKRIASGNALSTDVDEAKVLKDHIHELQREDILPVEKLKASNRELEKIDQTVEDIKEKTRMDYLKSIDSSIDKYQSILDNRTRTPNGVNQSNSYKEALKRLAEAKEELQEYKNGLVDVTDITETQREKIKLLTQNCEDAANAFKAMTSAEKGSTKISREKEIDKISKYLKQNTKLSKQAREDLNSYLNLLKSDDPSVNVEKIHAAFLNVANSEREAGREGNSFFSMFKNSGIHKLASDLAGMIGVYDVINLVKQGIGVVHELDTAFTEMRKVSDETEASLKNYQKTTFATADAVGTTAAQIQNSTADWMRLGESMNQAAESAKDANILLNVSEFEGIDEATESLVSMSQAYKDLDKMDIIDVLNNIGNNYSISTDGLATALKDSASALVTANNDLNEAVSLTTAGNAITQDPSKVGAGLRTISLRLVGTEEAKQELSDLGEETDGMITTVSKLRDTIMGATKAASSDGKGFDILDSNGNYKSTYEIMQGLADLYDNIVKKDKELGTNNLNLLLETIAGKNRSNIAASILQNGDMLRSVYEDAQNSEGSAEKELNSYLDSIDGKMAQLENRAQEFWFKVIDSEAIKNGVDLLSTLLKCATDFVDTVGLLPTILAGIGAALSFKNVGILELN